MLYILASQYWRFEEAFDDASAIRIKSIVVSNVTYLKSIFIS